MDRLGQCGGVASISDGNHRARRSPCLIAYDRDNVVSRGKGVLYGGTSRASGCAKDGNAHGVLSINGE
ncbi:hypothetical protein GCM10027414_29810 [Humibacter ginsengiterrae]